MPLTPKQKAFADYYLECGNGAEAARRAGYKPKYARQMATENLAKPDVSEYIAERMAKQDEERVAKADEILRFYTSVMRGEVKDQFGLDSSLTDRLKAADSLMKRHELEKTLRGQEQTAEDDALTKSIKALGEKMEAERVKAKGKACNSSAE